MGDLLPDEFDGLGSDLRHFVEVEYRISGTNEILTGRIAAGVFHRNYDSAITVTLSRQWAIT